MFEENSGRKSSWIIVTLSVSKSSMFKMFSFHKIKGQRFQTPPVWRAFSCRISVDGRPDRRNKATFSISPEYCGRGLRSAFNERPQCFFSHKLNFTEVYKRYVSRILNFVIRRKIQSKGMIFRKLIILSWPALQKDATNFIKRYD